MLKVEVMTWLFILLFPNVTIIRSVARTRKLFSETNLHAALDKPGWHDSKDMGTGFSSPSQGSFEVGMHFKDTDKTFCTCQQQCLRLC